MKDWNPVAWQGQFQDFTVVLVILRPLVSDSSPTWFSPLQGHTPTCKSFLFPLHGFFLFSLLLIGPFLLTSLPFMVDCWQRLPIVSSIPLFWSSGKVWRLHPATGYPYLLSSWSWLSWIERIGSVLVVERAVSQHSAERQRERTGWRLAFEHRQERQDGVLPQSCGYPGPKIRALQFANIILRRFSCVLLACFFSSQRHNLYLLFTFFSTHVIF